VRDSSHVSEVRFLKDELSHPHEIDRSVFAELFAKAVDRRHHSQPDQSRLVSKRTRRQLQLIAVAGFQDARPACLLPIAANEMDSKLLSQVL